MLMLTKIRRNLVLALGAVLVSEGAAAQYPKEWEEQRSDPSLSATVTVVGRTRIIKIQNNSASFQAYNLFLAPSKVIAAGASRRVRIQASRVSGNLNEFGLGFHLMDSSGAYETESQENRLNLLGTSLTPLNYRYKALGSGIVRPRVSIANIPAGAVFEIAIGDAVAISTASGSTSNPTPVPTPAPTPTPAPSCSMSESGPIRVTRNGQVIENLIIKANGGDAVLVDGFSDVIIRNVSIEHNKGRGIVLMHAPRTTIENVAVKNTGSPAAGANSLFNEYNIDCWESPDSSVRNARLENGSTGIQLDACPGMKMSFIEGHNFRGPYPRGQLVQFGASDNSVLEDFSVVNDATSWAEDNVNVYDSSNITIRRGLVDGNNSPSGVGVMIEQVARNAQNAFIEDVDAIHQGDGCFSAGPSSKNVTFNRVRCSENICSSQQGRGVPLSGGLAFGGWLGSVNLRLTNASYQNLCAPQNIISVESAFTTAAYSPASFVPRKPISLQFCFR